MRKQGKEPSHPRIVQLGPDTFTDKSSISKAKLDMKRAVTITRTTIVRATAGRCFELITRQLEETPDWDPTIMWVSPISIKHVRVGSTSRVTFNIGGDPEEAVVMVRSFNPNRSLLWTSTHSTQLQEEWQLEREPHGTLVTVILGYNPTGRFLGRLTDRMLTRGRIENAVSDMLERFRVTAEKPQGT